MVSAGGRGADSRNGTGRGRHDRTGDERRLKIGIILFALLLGLGTISIVAISVLVNRAADKVEDATFGEGTSEHPAEDDVELVTCETGATTPEIQVRITNHSSERSNYIISVNLLDDDDNKVGDASGAESNIAPDQQATTDLFGSDNTFSDCEIGDVTRFASD